MVSETTIARAQIGLAWFYAGMFGGVLALIILRPPTADAFVQAMLQTLLGGLMVLCTQQNSYFFARQRPDTQQPGETTVTTKPQVTTVVTTASTPIKDAHEPPA